MNIVVYRISPPKTLINRVREQQNITTFVETGTYKAATAMWASEHFARVITIENAQGLYEQNVAQYGGTANIEFLLGDTRTKLREIVPALNLPAIFWLDAHWCAVETFGQHEECPILDEIAIINGSDQQHVIVIDDARLFLSPPPKAHDAALWPDISSVLHALGQGRFERYTVVYGDVIIAVPMSMKASMVAFYQEQAAHDAFHNVSDVFVPPSILTRLRARLAALR